MDDTLKGIIYELMDELTEGGKDREYIINWVFNALPELKKQASMFREPRPVGRLGVTND